MSVGRLPDRWHSRDFPVLIEAARAIDGGLQPDPDEIATATLLETGDVERALVALRDGNYLVDIANGPIDVGGPALGWLGTWTKLTERGRRAVGIWPSGDDVDALVDALRQAEQSTTDAAEQGRIRQAAAAVMSVSREVMVDVIASVINKQTGIG